MRRRRRCKVRRPNGQHKTGPAGWLAEATVTAKAALTTSSKLPVSRPSSSAAAAAGNFRRAATSAGFGELFWPLFHRVIRGQRSEVTSHCAAASQPASQTGGHSHLHEHERPPSPRRPRLIIKREQVAGGVAGGLN